MRIREVEESEIFSPPPLLADALSSVEGCHVVPALVVPEDEDPILGQLWELELPAEDVVPDDADDVVPLDVVVDVVAANDA